MTAETKPRRGRKFLKILGGLLIIMIVIVALLPTIASTGMGKSWVTARLKTTLDRDVTIGEFDAGWGSGIEFTDLSVSNPAGFTEDALFSAATFLLKPGLTDALGGSLDMEIVLRDARLRIEKKPDGTTNLDGLGAAEEKEAGKGRESSEPAPMALKVTVENFSLTMLDLGKPEGERETVVEDLDLVLTLSGDEPGSIAGVLEATIQRVATAGGLKTEPIKIGGKAEKGRFVLEQLDVPLGGGRIVANGAIDLTQGSAFTSNVTVESVHLQRGFPLLDYVLPIFSLDGGGTAEGTLSATVALSGSRLDFDSLVSDLTGNGEIRVSKGKLRGNSIVAQVLTLAGESGAYEFDEIATGFSIADGRVTTPKVKIGEGALRMRLEGSVGLDGTVDYILRMKPKGDTWKKIRKELGEDGGIPIKITGSIGNLNVEEPKPDEMLKRLLDKKTGGLLDGLIGK